MTRVRRLAVIALCLVPLAAGCGGGSSSNAKSPLDEALGYLPKNAPFAVAIDTDLNGAQWKSLRANLEKFPFAGQIESSLKSSISQQGFDFDKDVKPLLGSDFVIGTPTASGLSGSHTEFVGAIQVKDKGKLKSVLSRSSNLQPDGSSNGATLYKESDGTESAQKDDVLLVADTKEHLIQALEQRDRSDRLTEDEFTSSLSGLPSSAIARAYFDAEGLINGSPGAAQARQVKWVGALRTIGLTASSQSDGISVDFDVKTDSSGVTDADLPIASGTQSPPVSAKPGEIGVGIRDLGQIVRFAESVAQTVSPASYGDFAKAKAQLDKRLGVNVDRDLVGQLSGNSSIAFDASGHYALRAEPKDPAAFARTLAKAARVAPAFAQGAGLKGARLTRSHGLYRLTGASGTTVYYGMVGKVFAASNDASRLAQIAAQAPQPVQGARGAVTINADIGKLVSQLVKQAAGGGIGGSIGGSLVAGSIGSLTGWANSSTSGIKGHLKLEIK